MNLRECLRSAAVGLCVATLLSAAPSSAMEPQQAAGPEAPKARRSRVSPQLSATVNTREAERRLEQARKKRDLGATPLAGESTSVPGGIAVNARYWNRQEKLRLEVEYAQRRLNKVQSPQVARR